MEPRRLIEAALFMSGRELSLNELKKLTGIASAGHVKTMVQELSEEYSRNGSALEIFEANGAYLMRVREEYLASARQFAQEAEISRSALRTLSYIARHNGILKSEVVKRIGPAIYDDVKELVERGFVFQRKFGRSSRLFLTDKFRAYFEQGGPVAGANLMGEGAKPEAGAQSQGKGASPVATDCSGPSGAEEIPE
ncbi:MAG: SMC-Scp complex subunit ScpB [Candidatus Bilamarchaeaceae archaeon]